MYFGAKSFDPNHTAVAHFLTFSFSVGSQETKGYMQSLVGYFKQYTEWVKNSVSILPPPSFLRVNSEELGF